MSLRETSSAYNSRRDYSKFFQRVEDGKIGQMKKKKIAIAISGGVDSGVAAALVVKAGYQAAGFHMHLWSEELKDRRFENKCCSTESLEAARKTAHQLGIPFYTVDFQKVFKKRVVDYFLKEYGLGRTPNPCVRCNRFIKFGELLSYIQKRGYDYLVTGHYARIIEDAEVTHRNFDVGFRFSREKTPVVKKSHWRSQSEASQNLVGSPRQDAKGCLADQYSSKKVPSSLYRLLMAVDKSKDQSYFLYRLNQRQLARVLFPVGGYLKTEVIKMAKKWKLPVAGRPESQEICFFPEDDYRPFLKRQIKKKIISGEVVNIKGRVIGKHQGIPLYTIGQRHGFTITDKKAIGPLYIVAKDPKENQLVVGFGKEVERKGFMVREVNWLLGRPPKKGLKCQVRVRHQGELLGCKLGMSSHGVAVLLNEGERGVAPGQAAVFFQGEEVLGGGIIAIDSKS